MKKTITKKKPKKEESVSEEVIATCAPKIDKLSISFQGEDLNKVVEKINEIIEKHG